MAFTIAGIIRSVERGQQDTDKSLATAFSDLESLMEQAREMVDSSSLSLGCRVLNMVAFLGRSRRAF
jgi:hypothetical protein